MSKGLKVFIINAISTLIAAILGLLVIWLLSQFTDCCDKDSLAVQIVGWFLLYWFSYQYAVGFLSNWSQKKI